MLNAIQLKHSCRFQLNTSNKRFIVQYLCTPFSEFSWEKKPLIFFLSPNLNKIWRYQYAQQILNIQEVSSNISESASKTTSFCRSAAVAQSIIVSNSVKRFASFISGAYKRGPTSFPSKALTKCCARNIRTGTAAKKSVDLLKLMAMLVIAKSTKLGRIAGTQLSSRMGSSTESCNASQRWNWLNTGTGSSTSALSWAATRMASTSVAPQWRRRIWKEGICDGKASRKRRSIPLEGSTSEWRNLSIPRKYTNHSKPALRDSAKQWFTDRGWIHWFANPLCQSSTVNASMRAPIFLEKWGTYVKRPCCNRLDRTPVDKRGSMEPSTSKSMKWSTPISRWYLNQSSNSCENCPTPIEGFKQPRMCRSFGLSKGQISKDMLFEKTPSISFSSTCKTSWSALPPIHLGTICHGKRQVISVCNEGSVACPEAVAQVIGEKPPATMLKRK